MPWYVRITLSLSSFINFKILFNCRTLCLGFMQRSILASSSHYLLIKISTNSIVRNRVCKQLNADVNVVMVNSNTANNTPYSSRHDSNEGIMSSFHNLHIQILCKLYEHTSIKIQTISIAIFAKVLASVFQTL